MGKIVLISCVSKKLSYKTKAKNLYVSPLFRYNLRHAHSLNPDKIFILSAKYGLVDLEEEIEPYDQTLNNMSKEGRGGWDEFIFLAGEKYRKFLIPHIKNYQIPMQGLGIGKQLKYLKDSLEKKEICEQLHKIFNDLKRISFPFNDEEIPFNGIYILFEKGENAHGGDRVVRIGTHTGQDNLRNRLKEHFLNENKDRSIFRKNIGRAILNKNQDDFIKQWELTPLIREVRESHPEIDFEKQKQIEKLVTKYIQDNFSFIVFRIDDKDERLKIESKIISNISLCEGCRQSINWLGNFSPKDKIKESGLWLVNELYKDGFSKEELEELKKILNN
jgi:hypothetical protein